MSYRRVVDMLAAAPTIAHTVDIERRAMSRRAWPQIHADLIRLAAIARRFELTKQNDCCTFIQPSTPESRGSRAPHPRLQERTNVRHRT